MITGDIGRAMATQVARVNNDPARLRELNADLMRKCDRLEEMVKDLTRRLEAAQERLEALQEVGATPQPSRGMVLDSRPVLTMAQASRQIGVSVATISRYLNTGYWHGVQTPSGRWYVYADQPLRAKPRK